ncbi:MAG: hypothetical protein R3C18_07695 [Planctomycetaceae bacterium]
MRVLVFAFFVSTTFAGASGGDDATIDIGYRVDLENCPVMKLIEPLAKTGIYCSIALEEHPAQIVDSEGHLIAIGPMVSVHSESSTFADLLAAIVEQNPNYTWRWSVEGIRACIVPKREGRLGELIPPFSGYGNAHEIFCDSGLLNGHLMTEHDRLLVDVDFSGGTRLDAYECFAASAAKQYWMSWPTANGKTWFALQRIEDRFQIPDGTIARLQCELPLTHGTPSTRDLLRVDYVFGIQYDDDGTPILAAKREDFDRGRWGRNPQEIEACAASTGLLRNLLGKHPEDIGTFVSDMGMEWNGKAIPTDDLVEFSTAFRKDFGVDDSIQLEDVVDVNNWRFEPIDAEYMHVFLTPKFVHRAFGAELKFRCQVIPAMFDGVRLTNRRCVVTAVE